MINEIQDIPVKDKRIPQYMSPEVQLQRAFIGAMVSALRDAVAGINITVPEDKREISLKSDTPIRVSNLDGIAKLLQAIEKKLTDLNAKEQPKIEIPSFPTAITVSNLPEVKPTDLSAISALLEDIKVALSASAGIEAVKVENLSDIQIPQVDYDLIANIVASVTSQAPTDFSSVIDKLDELKPKGGVVLPPTPGNVVRDNAVSSFKALTGTTAEPLFSASTKATRIDITVTGGPVAVGFDSSVSAVSGSENGVMLYPANVPYSIYMYDLSNIYVAGANGRRVCYAYFI